MIVSFKDAVKISGAIIGMTGLGLFMDMLKQLLFPIGRRSFKRLQIVPLR